MIRSIATFCAAFLATASANAALVGRLPATPGGTDYQAYFDTDLNVTWQANASLSLTQSFGQAPNITGAGRMTRDTTDAWVAGMNSANYLGFNDWRLPTVTDTGAPGCPNNGFDPIYANFPGQDCGYNVDPATGEMAHLFFATLGNTSLYDTSGNYTNCINLPGMICLTNPGPFANLVPRGYWYSTQPVGSPNLNFAFDFGAGIQTLINDNPGSAAYAWVVRTGDVVPVPSAAFLFPSALAALGFRRRRAA